jgi:hypothetical protein
MSHQLIYLHHRPEAALCQVRQAEASRVVLVAEITTSQAYKETIAKELAQGNCLYFMAWGSESEAWHDAVDMANIEQFDFLDIPQERFIMTTWHEDEPLSEVLCFCKNSAFHALVELKHTVLLHVSPEPREQDLLEQYAAA